VVDSIEVILEGQVLERYNNLKKQWESCCRAEERASTRLRQDSLSPLERERIQRYLRNVRQDISRLTNEMQGIFDRL
jgi:hypothetical protein